MRQGGSRTLGSSQPAEAKSWDFIHFERLVPPKPVPKPPAASLASQAVGKIVTVSSNGTSYYYTGATKGGSRWIPDAETYWCLRLRYKKQVLTIANQSQANSLGNGQPWTARCFAPSRVLNKVVREGGGFSYFVSADGAWHWIPTGALYNCLVKRYPLINNATWEQIDSLRISKEYEGPQDQDMFHLRSRRCRMVSVRASARSRRLPRDPGVSAGEIAI